MVHRRFIQPWKMIFRIPRLKAGLTLVCLTAAVALAQEPGPTRQKVRLETPSLRGDQPANPVYVRVPLHNREQLRELEQQYPVTGVIPDTPASTAAVAEVLIPPGEWEQMQARWPGSELDFDELQLDESDMADSLTEALTYTKYPTYPQYEQIMQRFQAEYPGLCDLDTLGMTLEGRLILALKISDNVDQEEDEPQFFYTGTIHGDELVGYILLLRLTDTLLASYGADPEITRNVNGLEIWINPLSNPDGTYHGGDHTVAESWRWNSQGTYDLNRNYPDPAAGDPDILANHPQENQVMMHFMYRKNFAMSANLHSGAEVVNYPWDHRSDRHPDDDWFYFISREYADEAHAVAPGYMDLFDNGVTNGWDWYDIYGGRQDYMTWYRQGREVTLELSNTKRLPSEQLADHWEYNHRSLLNYMSQALYGIHGTVTGAATGLPLKARVEVLNHDSAFSVVWSDTTFGSFTRYLKQGIYDLAVSASGYHPDTIYDVSVIDYQATRMEIRLDSLGDPDHLPGRSGDTDVVRLWPNPATDLLHVSFPEPGHQPVRYTVCTLAGRLVATGTALPGETRIRIPVASLPPGTYLLFLESSDERVVRKFIRHSR